jgi:hypothetical protein
VLGRGIVRVNGGDHDTLVTGAFNLVCRGNRQTEAGNALRRLVLGLLRLGALLCLVWHLRQGHGDHLRLTLAQDVEFRRASGSHARDLARQ